MPSSCRTRPFPWREADPERPVLPFDLPAVDGEAWALRLHDVERLDALSRLRKRLLPVIALLLRHRNDFVIIDEIDHLVLDEIDDSDHPLDRMGVAVVANVFAPVRDGTDDSFALFEFAAK